MKRLKKSCPFGGKQYPGYLLLFSLIFGVSFGIIGFPSLVSVLLLSPIIVAAICYAVEQHLTAGERDIIAKTENPLWQPVTPEIKSLVIEQQTGTQLTLPQMLIASFALAGLLFLVGVSPSRSTHRSMVRPDIMLGVSLVAAAGVFIWLMLTKGIGANWMEIDDTAVFTQVPIHHMYDVTHHGRHGRQWVESYLVFYQPDGRYILHAPKDSGFGNMVTVVKFRGSLTWLVTEERHWEDEV